jgi:hypothetical protein
MARLGLGDQASSHFQGCSTRPCARAGRPGTRRWRPRSGAPSRSRRAAALSRRSVPGRQAHALVGPLAAGARTRAIAAEDARRNRSNAALWSRSSHHHRVAGERGIIASAKIASAKAAFHVCRRTATHSHQNRRAIRPASGKTSAADNRRRGATDIDLPFHPTRISPDVTRPPPMNPMITNNLILT